MIKEIINLGQAMGVPHAAAFTMHLNRLHYLKLDISADFKNVEIGEGDLESVEQFLKLGIFREKAGSRVVYLPGSFLIPVSNGKVKDTPDLFENGLKRAQLPEESREFKFLKRIYEIIRAHWEELTQRAVEIAESKKGAAQVGVALYYDGLPVYCHHNLFHIFRKVRQEIYFAPYLEGNRKRPVQVEGICSITGKKAPLYYPKANFYYPFSVDKKIVKFELRDEKNIFPISAEAIDLFFAGKEYMEQFNRYFILNTPCYLTATPLRSPAITGFDYSDLCREGEEEKEGVLYRFEREVIQSQGRYYSDLTKLLGRLGNKYRSQLLLNFYFFVEPSQGSPDIVAYIRDVMPSYLVGLELLFEEINSNDFQWVFNKKGAHWTYTLSSILEGEGNRRELLKHFGHIVLGEPVQFRRILFLINRKSEELIRKLQGERGRRRKEEKRWDKTPSFPLHYYLLLIWLKQRGEMGKEETINFSEGAEMGHIPEIEGNSYQERLENVLSRFPLLKDNPSAQIGVCVGLILKMLSFSINDFDKKVLAFASKKLGRDLNSLLKFVNPIFERAKLHQKSIKVDINIACATQRIARLEEFDKEWFIFGLFFGNALYKYLKGEEDEHHGAEDEGEGAENGQ